MKPGNGTGQYFDSHLKENQSLVELTPRGKALIDKFCKQNKKTEKFLRDQEEVVWKYRHSKPDVEWNGWKPANHTIKEFSAFPSDSFEMNNRTGKGDINDIAAKVDKIHSFSVERKKPFYNEEPFWNSHKDGGYFFNRTGVNIHKY